MWYFHFKFDVGQQLESCNSQTCFIFMLKNPVNQSNQSLVENVGFSSCPIRSVWWNFKLLHVCSVFCMLFPVISFTHLRRLTFVCALVDDNQAPANVFRGLICPHCCIVCLDVYIFDWLIAFSSFSIPFSPAVFIVVMRRSIISFWWIQYLNTCIKHVFINQFFTSGSKWL